MAAKVEKERTDDVMLSDYRSRRLGGRNKTRVYR
jgi:hypothetical protein